MYGPLQSSGWSLGVLFPRQELMADLTALNRKVLVFGAIGFCILLLVTIIIAGSITRPLRLLAKTTDEISQGNLDFSIPARITGDETGRLAQSFGTMRDALKKHIAELTAATAAKERIESELKIAHDIQTNMLPRIYPPFPDRKEIDLFAMIQPAREVGGDFFDFFFVDERNLFFYIADVAGKGVPASLFMAVTRTLIKTKCSSGLKPEQVLARVNDDLCMDNDACMFVTLFAGMLDVQSGKLVYVNGGHNPPLLCRSGQRFEFLQVHPGIALGVMHGVTFVPQSVQLDKGDAVFLYTDGVNEALNTRKELFGVARLQRALDDGREGRSRELIQHVYASIVSFTEGEDQSDDITMLALKFTGTSYRSDGTL
jgi:sigma-B regulation protein RsbU (phosphoserine phosphatase)